MTAINNDAANNDDSFTPEFDGEGAFAKLWGIEDASGPSDTTKADDDEDKKKKKSASEDEGSEDDTGDEGDEGDDKSTDEADEDGEDEENEGDDNEANVVVKDDYKVKIKVGDEEKEFTIGSLKRLAGQEASLTQKSQEVATKRKQLDTQAATQVAVLDRMLAAAKKRFEPYQNINLLAASKDPNISQEELVALQQAYNSSYDDVRFLTQELGVFQQELQKQRKTELSEQAAETVKVLSDPDKGIPGFSQKLYGEMQDYAIKQGVPEDAWNEITDHISLRILHKAMLYDRGAQKVKQESDPKTATSKKVSKAPKKIVKSLSNTDNNREAFKGSKDDSEQAAMKRLRKTGSSEDAEAAFLARFSRE
jgi:hypothetical protein